VAHTQWWISVPNAGAKDVDELIATYDVRGHFEGLVLLVAPESELATIRLQFPRARTLRPVGDEHLVVLERPTFMNDRPDTVTAWTVETARVLTDAGHIVVLTLPRRVVAAIKGDYARLERLPLPDEVEFVPLAERALRLRSSRNSERIQQIRRKFAYRAEIEEVLAEVNSDSLGAFARYLSGENSSSPLYTRNSYSDDVHVAADWLQEQFESYGFNVTQETFRSDMGPNVIGVRKGTVYPDTYVIISGHYDSRAASSSSPTQRAPGANDDGSGTSALLEIARIIHEQQLSFEYSVVVGAWCGEEQGLVGSRAYAGAAADQGMDILAVFQVRPRRRIVRWQAGHRASNPSARRPPRLALCRPTCWRTA